MIENKWALCFVVPQLLIKQQSTEEYKLPRKNRLCRYSVRPHVTAYPLLTTGCRCLPTELLMRMPPVRCLPPSRPSVLPRPRLRHLVGPP